MTLTRKAAPTIATALTVALLLTGCGDPADTTPAADVAPAVTTPPKATPTPTPEIAPTQPTADASDLAALASEFSTFTAEEEPDTTDPKEPEAESTEQPGQSKTQTPKPKPKPTQTTTPKPKETQAPKPKPSPKPTQSTSPPKPKEEIIKNWGTLSGETAILNNYRKGLGLNLDLGPSCYYHGNVSSLDGARGILNSSAHTALISGHRTKLVNARVVVEDRGVSNGVHRIEHWYSVDIQVCPPAG